MAIVPKILNRNMFKDFKNVGNDELTSALENIRTTSDELQQRQLKKTKNELQKANHLLSNSVPKHHVNQFSPLKVYMSNL